MTFTYLALVFLIGSVFGWVWETVYCLARNHKFIYRGLLAGPYCPIYGFGAVLILPITVFNENPLYLFVVAALVATAVEFTTSVLLEKLLKIQLWSYKREVLNVDGRVCLRASVMWGLMALFLAYFLEPQVRGLAAWTYDLFGIWPATVLIAAVVVDAILTITRLTQFRSFMASTRTNIGTTVEGYIKSIEETRRKNRLHATERRVLKAFPQLGTSGIGSKAELNHILMADAALKKTVKQSRKHKKY